MQWIGRWRKLCNPNPVHAGRIDEAAWQQLLDSSPLFARLDARSALVLRNHCEQFLARKSFSAAGEHALEDTQCLAIAALACLPILELGIDWLDGWRDVIVYPGSFRVRREHCDEHTGVITDIDDDVIGEAWDCGPVILSWADVAADLASPFDGFNVVIHEIAHKLDMLDGAMNGVPRLPESIRRAEWIGTFQQAYDDFVHLIDSGAPSAVDAYAAESPDEFFAVVTELYFSNMCCLKESMPGVADLLDRLYGNPSTSAAG